MKERPRVAVLGWGFLSLEGEVTVSAIHTMNEQPKPRYARWEGNGIGGGEVSGHHLKPRIPVRVPCSTIPVRSAVRLEKACQASRYALISAARRMSVWCGRHG